MMKRLLIPFLALAVLAPFAFAGDTHDVAVNVRETETDLVAFGTIDMASDSTGNFYTQPVYIGDANLYSAFLGAYTNDETGDDVNVLVEYSFDRYVWKLSTQASGVVLDSLNGGTVQADTINIVAGAADGLFHAAVWVRFKFDGQATNPDETDVTWWAHFTKTYASKPLSRTRRVRDRVTS